MGNLAWFIMFSKIIICLAAAFFTVFISIKTNSPKWLKIFAATASGLVILYMAYTLMIQ